MKFSGQNVVHHQMMDKLLYKLNERIEKAFIHQDYRPATESTTTGEPPITISKEVRYMDITGNYPREVLDMMVLQYTTESEYPKPLDPSYDNGAIWPENDNFDEVEYTTHYEPTASEDLEKAHGYENHTDYVSFTFKQTL